jgi:hypothetical protein
MPRAGSQETPLRDVSDLMQPGLLKKNEGGRSTSYSLAEGPAEQARKAGTCGVMEIAHKRRRAAPIRR